MTSARQTPVAVTGMGLLCRRLDRELGLSRRAPPRFFWLEKPPVHPLPGHESFRSWYQGRSLKLALGAACAAAGPAGLETRRAGAAITISKGLIEVMEEAAETLHARGPRHVPVGAVQDCGADAAARAVAHIFGMTGPAAAAVAACASGLASVKLGLDWLRDGVCDTVLAGAAESSFSDLVIGGFARMGALSAAGVARPFDKRRDGFVSGEGAAVFRLELRPAAPPLAYLLGVALAADAWHITTPDPSGAVIAETISQALARAGLTPDGIGWVHAHGTATRANDSAEIAGLRAVFGRNMPPVTATKGATGHALGASGAVALGITIESLRGKIIPPCLGLAEPDPEFAGVDFVRGRPRHSSARTALVLNYGFGGHVAAAVVGVL